MVKVIFTETQRLKQWSERVALEVSQTPAARNAGAAGMWVCD